MRKDIMIKLTTSPVHLAKAVAISDPDSRGMVKLEEPVYAGEMLGYITSVSATQCLAYDEVKMTIINQLTGIGIEYYKAAKEQANTCPPAWAEFPHAIDVEDDVSNKTWH